MTFFFLRTIEFYKYLFNKKKTWCRLKSYFKVWNPVTFYSRVTLLHLASTVSKYKCKQNVIYETVF